MSLSTTVNRVLHYVWAAPCTVVGLCLASPALFFGGGLQVVAGVVEVFMFRHGEPNVILRLLPFNAITFGHVVMAKTEADLHRLRAHELEHVRQYEKWGVLFFVAYSAASLWELLRGGRPYWDNWFEVQARAKETNENTASKRPSKEIR